MIIFFYSRDLTAWFRGDSVGRIKMLVTSRGWRVNIDGYEENQALRLRGRENDSCKQKGQENTFLGWNAKYPPYFIIYSSTTDRRSTDEIVCHISSHFIFIRNLWRYGTIQINRSLSLSLSLYLSISIAIDFAMDITDPSSMQNACHMNFVIDLRSP